jgi:hypothetical protein
MTVLLYAVTETGAPLAGQGLDDRPLREIVDNGLAAVVSDHDGPPSPTESNLWTFEHIVEQLMACTSVVPARFGATADDDDDVRTMLAARQAELQSALARLAGTVEFAVHAGPSGSGSASAAVRTSGSATGTDYMLMRLSEQRQARELKERVDAAVGDLALASTSLTHAPDRLAYLVAQDDVTTFAGRLIAMDDPNVSWTGPWPPYSFTTPGEAR